MQKSWTESLWVWDSGWLGLLHFLDYTRWGAAEGPMEYPEMKERSSRNSPCIRLLTKNFKCGSEWLALEPCLELFDVQTVSSGPWWCGRLLQFYERKESGLSWRRGKRDIKKGTYCNVSLPGSACGFSGTGVRMSRSDPLHLHKIGGPSLLTGHLYASDRSLGLRAHQESPSSTSGFLPSGNRDGGRVIRAMYWKPQVCPLMRKG